MSIAMTAVRQRLRAASEDNEFLAPALQILETPLSPVRAALIWIICALVTAALVWAYFGRIDIIASAQGKLQPNGRVKVVESVETGKIALIHAVNGDHVAKGDVLIDLDPAEVMADRRAASDGLASVKAEALRRRAALAAIEARAFDRAPTIPWPEDAPAPLRLRESRSINADFSQLEATIASLTAQRAQKEIERDELTKTIATQTNLVATLQERVTMRQSLIEKGAGARGQVLDAQEAMQVQQTQLGTLRGQFASTMSGLAVFNRDMDKAIEAFVSDNAQKLGEAERKSEDLEQALAKASARLDHLTLRAPIDGVVQASVVTNIGQVVGAGAEIMRVVPEDAGLEIQAYVGNADIGFVKTGQEATIKIASFPFTRYGTIRAKVTSIGRDAIPEPDATNAEGDPTRGATSTGLGGAQRVQNLVFPVTLAPEATVIRADGEEIPLSSGMATTVEFKTGNRRLIEFVFSPLVEITATALHER